MGGIPQVRSVFMTKEVTSSEVPENFFLLLMVNSSLEITVITVKTDLT